MNASLTLLFYLLIEAISLSFAYLARASKKRHSSIKRGESKQTKQTIRQLPIENLYMSISFFSLLLTAVLRNGVGTDYSTYVNVYYRVASSSLSRGEMTWIRQSPLFYVICVLCTNFGLSSYTMFAIVAFITLFFIYKSIMKSSSDWLISLYLYLSFCLYFQSFNQIRQMAAVSISFYALTHLQEWNYKKFVFWIIVAAGFHLSAIVMLVLLLFGRFNNTRTVRLTYLAIGLFVFFFFPIILKLLSKISYIQIYQNSIYSTSFNMTSVLNLLVRVTMVGICYITLSKIQPLSISERVLLNSAVLCSILQICAIHFSIFGRVTTYFFMAFLLLIPETLKIIQKHFTYNSAMIVRCSFIVLCFTYQMVYYFSGVGASGGGYKIYTTI